MCMTMKLIMLDYIILGIVLLVVANHAVFMAYEKLRNRRKVKRGEACMRECLQETTLTLNDCVIACTPHSGSVDKS